MCKTSSYHCTPPRGNNLNLTPKTFILWFEEHFPKIDGTSCAMQQSLHQWHTFQLKESENKQLQFMNSNAKRTCHPFLYSWTSATPEQKTENLIPKYRQTWWLRFHVQLVVGHCLGVQFHIWPLEVLFRLQERHGFLRSSEGNLHLSSIISSPIKAQLGFWRFNYL